MTIFNLKNTYIEGTKTLNIFKAPGPDGLRPRVLEELSSELVPILILFFLAPFHQLPLLDICKYANVNPIYKKGDNYQFIVLCHCPAFLINFLSTLSVATSCNISPGTIFYVQQSMGFVKSEAVKPNL